MNRVVISQPMVFPWVGLFEQIRLADIYVHYDDVQLPLGRSFMSRVQIKAPQGIQWLSIPIKRRSFQLINQVEIDSTQNWRNKHLKTLQLYYKKAPYVSDMLQIVCEVYGLGASTLDELNSCGIEKISKYFDLSPKFIKSSPFNIHSSGSDKLLQILLELKGEIYITGHGAKNYLDHVLLERKGIKVEYMDYKKIPYPQLYGEFTPYVSILDLIANTGKEGKRYICSTTKNWREYIGSPIER